MKLKIKLYIIGLFGYMCALQAQQLTPTVQPVQGGTLRNGSLGLTYTIGQTLTPVSAVNTLLFTPGFQQPIIPQPPVAPAPQTVCSGTAYTFAFYNVAAGKGGSKIEWAANAAFDSSHLIVSPGTITALFNPGTADTIWLRSVDSTSGVKSTAVFTTATVHQSPKAYAGQNTSVDISTSAVLGDTTQPIGGTPPYTFSWSPSNGLSDTTIPQPVATPLASTSYILLVTDSNGCTGSDTVTVYFNASTSKFTEITYSAENMAFSDSAGQAYVDFDVFASDTPEGLLFSQGIIFIQYDTLIFGKSIVDSGKIVASKGQAIDTSFYHLNLADSTPNMLKISITHDTGSTYFTNIGEVYKQLCHLKVDISAFNFTGVAAAYDSIAMAGLSKYRRTLGGIEFPYNIVRVSGLEEAQSSEDDSVTLTYAIINIDLDTSVSPPNLTFDIVANASADVPLNVADIWVKYNSSTLTLVNTANIALESSWIPPDGVDNNSYNTTVNTSSGEFEILIQADNLPTAYHHITISNTPEPIAHVTIQVSNCSGQSDLAFDTAKMSANDFLDTVVNAPAYYNVLCIQNSGANNQACTHCPGTDVDFTLSNFILSYDTGGTGFNAGKLEFTVNYKPTSTFFTSGYLYKSTVTIDYNGVIFDDVVSNSGFQIFLDASLVANSFTHTESGSYGQFSVVIVSPLSTPLAFTFGQGLTPLFTVTMPFDNSDVDCENSCQVQFDNAMNSGMGTNQVLTYYDTASNLSPNSFCSESVEPNDTLFNTVMCPSPIVNAVSAGIYGDQCPTSGSMIPVTITGKHFLNGYTWTRLDTTFAGYLKFINADQGDYCTTCVTPNTLNSTWAVNTNAYNILSWTDSQIDLLVPTIGNTNAATAGSGPFQIIVPSGLATWGLDSIYLEYAIQNEASGGRPCMPYLTSTQTAVTNNPYTSFPMYTFDFNTALRDDDSALTAVMTAIADVQCTMRAPLFIDSNYYSNALNNSTSPDTTVAKDGINEIFLVDSNNSVVHNAGGGSILGITIIKGHFTGCVNYANGTGTYDSSYPNGYIVFYETGIDIYINSTPRHPYSYSLLCPSNHLNFLSVIAHELGHGLLVGHSNHNPFLSSYDHGQGFDASRIMYFNRKLGEVFAYYYDDPDDARGAIRALQWPTNGDGQNYNGITLSTHCDTTAAEAAAIARPPTCNFALYPGACSDTVVWMDLKNILQQQKMFGVTLFPNPSQGNAILQIDIDQHADFTIFVYDILGDKIYATEKSSSVPFQVPLDLEAVSSGVYIITVWSSDGGQRSLKFIKTY